MKIAFILPNISSGGAERVVSILSASLVEKGYDVDIVLLYDGKIQYEIDQRVKIVNLMTAGESKVKRILTLRKYIKNERNYPLIFELSCHFPFIPYGFLFARSYNYSVASISPINCCIYSS